MTTLVLWRHGQTDENAAGRFQGRVDAPLNEAGLEQAAQAAKALVRLQPSMIVSSPLQRARATAGILAERTGLGVRCEAGLVERSFGQWERLTRDEVAQQWPEQYRRWRDGVDPEGLGIETRLDVARRVSGVLRRLVAESAPEDVVVIVSHGAACTFAAMDLLGQDASRWSGLRGMDNCRHALLTNTSKPPGWRLVGWNLA